MPLKIGSALIMKKYNLFVMIRMSQEVWWWYEGCVVYSGSLYIMKDNTGARRHADMKYWGNQNNLLFRYPSYKYAGCLIMVVLLYAMLMR